MDIFLGIDKLPFKMTVDMMLKVAYIAQNQGSYEAAQEMLGIMGFAVNDDTIRLVVNHIGSLVFQDDCNKTAIAEMHYIKGDCPFALNREGVLYIQTDGAALNTRHTNESKSSTWRENKLGLFFSSDNIRYWKDKHGNRQHQINKKEYISYIGNADIFKYHLFSGAIKNGYGSYKTTVILSDGATWIANIAKEMYINAYHILDFYHFAEHIYEYSKKIYNLPDDKAKLWAHKICEAAKKSDYSFVFKEINNSKGIDNDKESLLTYINNHSHMIDYNKYINLGFFIGSGAIESGNKIVLQERLKRAGQRWNSETAQFLLTLKAKQASKLWEKEVASPVKAIYNC
jgi:hypothetical protein